MPFLNLCSSYARTCHLLMHTWPQWSTVYEKNLPEDLFLHIKKKPVTDILIFVRHWKVTMNLYTVCLRVTEGHEACVFSIGNRLFSILMMYEDKMVPIWGTLLLYGWCEDDDNNNVNSREKGRTCATRRMQNVGSCCSSLHCFKVVISLFLKMLVFFFTTLQRTLKTSLLYSYYA